MSSKALSDAEQGDVFRHETTGAEISVAMRAPGGELLTVQLNKAADQQPGWVSFLYTTAKGWSFVRNAQ